MTAYALQIQPRFALPFLIVTNYQLPIGVRLSEYALDCSGQEFDAMKRGNCNRYERCPSAMGLRWGLRGCRGTVVPRIWRNPVCVHDARLLTNFHSALEMMGGAIPSVSIDPHHRSVSLNSKARVLIPTVKTTILLERKHRTGLRILYHPLDGTSQILRRVPGGHNSNLVLFNGFAKHRRTAYQDRPAVGGRHIQYATLRGERRVVGKDHPI